MLSLFVAELWVINEFPREVALVHRGITPFEPLPPTDWTVICALLWRSALTTLASVVSLLLVGDLDAALGVLRRPLRSACGRPYPAGDAVRQANAMMMIASL